MDGPRILLVAGEASGDAHAARLASALKELEPGCRLFGVGGPMMRASGVQLLADEDLGVIGFVEVLRKLPVLRRVRNRVRRFLREKRPHLFIPVDYPGFNLPMCDTAKDYGITVMYYISPQVWAWGKGRVKKIARRVDKMLTILPFESGLYEGKGVEVEFVGHPLLESLEAETSPELLRSEIGAAPEARILGLLPGSRRDEVARLLPVMLEAGTLLQRDFPSLRVVVAAASHSRGREIREIGERWIRGAASATVVEGRTRALMQASEVVLVASGTATLEAACMETPMVVLYRLSLFSWVLGRLLIKVPYIALANLVAERRVVPELIQGNATADRAAMEASKLLSSRALQSSMKKDLREVRQRLGTPGASRRAARAALSLISVDARREGE